MSKASPINPTLFAPVPKGLAKPTPAVASGVDTLKPAEAVATAAPAKPTSSGGAASRVKSTVMLSADLHREIKIACVDHGVSVQDVLEQGARLWLDAKKAQ